MLAIAWALLVNPKLLIAMSRPRGPLIVRMSFDVADQAYVLDNGSVVYSGPAQGTRRRGADPRLWPSSLLGRTVPWHNAPNWS